MEFQACARRLYARGTTAKFLPSSLCEGCEFQLTTVPISIARFRQFMAHNPGGPQSVERCILSVNKIFSDERSSFRFKKLDDLQVSPAIEPIKFITSDRLLTKTSLEKFRLGLIASFLSLGRAKIQTDLADHFQSRVYSSNKPSWKKQLSSKLSFP